MKRNHSSPFACLRALLMLPVVLAIILLASACKSDTVQDTSSDASAPTVEEPMVTPEPYDTLAFLEKFSHGQGQDDFIIVSQLNHFITIEADGSIWFNIAGQNNYQRAYLPSLDNDFEHAKSLSTVEVKNPEKVFVMYNRDNHLDICAEVIRQLQKSYSDENIIFALEPWKRTVPPPPGLTIDTDKDDYLIVMINADNEIRMEGKWTPGEGIRASFNSNGNISPLDIETLDDYIRTGIPAIKEKTPPESLVVDGLKAYLKWDLTCSSRVLNEVERIIRRYVWPGYIIRQSPTAIISSK